MTLAMEPLEPPDSMYLRAAEGWLDLGNATEAALELEQLSPAAREHGEVLGVRWQIAAKHGHWDEGLAVADALCRVAPAMAFGWIHRSYCLHELKRTREAWDALRPVADRFPREWLICYNLACYACGLGQVEEARNWFARALVLGDADEIKKLAAGDADLKPLFPLPG
jgi:tetratricopeptide (TPR) repeat protein